MNLSKAEEFRNERVTVLYNECHVIHGEVVGMDEQGIVVRCGLKNLIPIDFETISYIGKLKMK